MLLLVPLDSWLLIFICNTQSVYVILFQNLEKWLVSTNSDSSELIIIPMLSVNVFDIQIRVAWEVSQMFISTNFANKGSCKHDTMSGSSALAINAIFIVWNG